MIPLLLILIAVLSYALGALNSAVLLSRFVFHKDLTKQGNGRPTYANFVRVNGSNWGYACIAVDVLKGVIAVLAGGLLMLIVGENYVVVGKLFAGFCLVLGNIYPVHHQLRGNKGVVACMTAMWLADWRVGLVATAVFVIVVAFSQYVSLAGMAAPVLGAVTAWLCVPKEEMKGLAGTLVLLMAVSIIWRHRGNIVRILNKREPRVKWGSRPQAERRVRDNRF